ncbi:Protein kinase domain-containing protein [Actinacidiphila yanglinensis]|uniref:Protein kinase domain-containing protein n=1 Tax=Actinacidiphila yanglinensis TaxID=310779 RepID=A0A1H6ALW4_9ACTN|nr:serine/threonine-protein kinase [Actinacidiphila yanglinensis]SEG49200.1 Protein kinase domain-containing protein [Actinacidiphila yanglinensis]
MMDSTIAEPLSPDDPQEIGSFHIIGLLGTGGMGEVYLGAWDRGYAAVKRVRPRLVTSERFEREVGILYRVPGGVGPRVLASDVTAERPWFATEYVPGLTVDEAVRLHGPLPAESLWLLLAEAAAQLRAVHAAEIAHRDVKPGNVMLVRDGVKLIDFGIARAADQARLTRTGAGYGTHGFAAPEQQAGDEDVHAPADVYALGALLLYAASGRTPGAVPDVEPLRAVDAGLAAVVATCLATDRGDRPTAGEVVEAARGHLPVDSPSWPAEVTARIASRRAFAATPVGRLETVPPPSPDAAPEPVTVPNSPAAPRRPRPRTRLLLGLAAGVVALGATATVLTFLPSASSGKGAGQSSGSAPATIEPVAGTTRPSAASSGHPGTSTASPSGPHASTAAKSPHPSAGSPGPTASVGAPHPGSGAGTTAPAKPDPHPTSSSISGINGTDDTTQVKGSEADTTWVGNDATCSAWLDDNGSGGLAGVLNTSLNQTCGAELYRSDGVAYTFQAARGAAKTTFLPDAGRTMWICVWNASDRSSEQCSPRFGMNGTTPVKE